MKPISAFRLPFVRAAAGAVAMACIGLTAPANAQTSADDLARRHFESGTAYLEQAEYEDALREFRKAHELSNRPEVLINVAMVQERMADITGAIASLEQYLAADPNGAHAETVRIRLENLKKRQGEQQAAPADAPATSEPAEPEPGSTARLETAPAPAPEAEQARQSSGGPGWPVYALFGVAGASAIGAVVTGIMAQSEYNDKEDTCAPTCTDDDLSTGRTLAITSTVLTGVAVVSGGIGAVLFFTSSPSDEARTSRPMIALDAGPNTAIARARWRF